jgi:acyl-CoA thioester hydrolase/thioesterase-3
MDRCYGMPMSEFQKLGFGWFLAGTEMRFRRPLGLGDRFLVRTWIGRFTASGVRVHFEIDRSSDRERCCDGSCDYVLIAIETTRPTRIPDWIIQKYSI